MVQNDEVSQLTKKVQKNPNDTKSHERLAEISCYRDEEGQLVFPSTYIEQALAKAGANQKVAGKGNKTYKDFAKGQLRVEPFFIPLTPQKYVVRYDYVVIQRARIQRARPEFPKWKAKLTLTSFDDTVADDKVEELLRYAGKYVGIGDWRPKYGLFDVKSFKMVEETS
jgi:hypothetical protein